MRRSIVIAATAVALLSGCSSTPTVCDVGYTHISHPLKGAPFGPESEEGTIDLIGPECRWESGDLSFNGNLSYKVPGSDLYGDDFVFIGRVAYRIWGRH